MGPRLRRGLALALTAGVLPFVFVRDPVRMDGTDTEGPWRPVDPSSVRLLVDRTAWDPAEGRRVIRQEIFDEILRRVDGAETVVFADFFLWNDWQGEPAEQHRMLSSEFAQALLARARSPRGIGMVALTDPLNRLYGEVPDPVTLQLMEGDVPLLHLDLSLLSDSNRLWSRPVRFYGPALNRIGFVRRALDRPLLAHPFDARGPRLSVRQAVRLLHFRANHRKVLVVDGEAGRLGVLVGSLNPADSSSAHGNSALWVEGAVACDALHSGMAVARATLGGAYGPEEDPGERVRVLARNWRSRWPVASQETLPGQQRVRWLTEGAVARAIEARLSALEHGDEVDVAVFYLADRGVVRALADAAGRGVRIRMILDPNRDAFGRRKNGIPNRPVAAELVRAARRRGWDLNVRWADTHGEQFHHKALFTRTSAGRHGLIIGSANWTRRNLRNLNLEANLEIEQVPGVAAAWDAWFETAWTNADGLSWTRSYEAFAESTPVTMAKTWLYRFQEWSGLSTF